MRRRHLDTRKPPWTAMGREELLRQIRILHSHLMLLAEAARPLADQFDPSRDDLVDKLKEADEELSAIEAMW